MVKDFFSNERKIYDSVHGFIRLDEFEKELIDTKAFQRLHYVHQLGISYLVYPGATHTRFEHSLGVLELSSRIYHNISKSVRPDVFDHVPRKGSPEYHYWRRVLRFASLCHDLGHLPFSHVAERALLKKETHEDWTLKIIRSDELMRIWEKVIDKGGIKDLFPERDFVEDICKIAVGEKVYPGALDPWERVVSDILTGDFFGSDRIDYLLRDSKSTGVAYGLFDYQQLIEMIRILPGMGEDELALGINENGLESCEALVLARHFMHRRVYQHSTVKAYNFHLSRFMKLLYEEKDFETVERFLKYTDVEVITELRRAQVEKNHPGHQDAVRICERKNRFRALPLNFDLSEKDLVTIREKQNIPDDAMGWEMRLHPQKQEPISFPVSHKHLTVSPASDVSDLLSNKLFKKSSWIFVAPDYEEQLIRALDDFSVQS